MPVDDSLRGGEERLMATGTLALPGAAFFQQRWNGAVSRHRLFWWDTLAVATLLNAALGMVSLILLTRGLEGGTWLVLHLLLLPYNLFLVAALWRKDDVGLPMRLAVLLWLALTVAI
jgi:hypothetical protein